jgi:hypothetical protein
MAVAQESYLKAKRALSFRTFPHLTNLTRIVSFTYHSMSRKFDQ